MSRPPAAWGFAVLVDLSRQPAHTPLARMEIAGTAPDVEGHAADARSDPVGRA